MNGPHTAAPAESLDGIDLWSHHGPYVNAHAIAACPRGIPRHRLERNLLRPVSAARGLSMALFADPKSHALLDTPLGACVRVGADAAASFDPVRALANARSTTDPTADVWLLAELLAAVLAPRSQRPDLAAHLLHRHLAALLARENAPTITHLVASLAADNGLVRGMHSALRSALSQPEALCLLAPLPSYAIPSAGRADALCAAGLDFSVLLLTRSAATPLVVACATFCTHQAIRRLRPPRYAIVFDSAHPTFTHIAPRAIDLLCDSTSQAGGALIAVVDSWPQLTCHAPLMAFLRKAEHWITLDQERFVDQRRLHAPLASGAAAQAAPTDELVLVRSSRHPNWITARLPLPSPVLRRSHAAQPA